MPIFELYLKSHCEAPDWEREVEASSKEEAIKLFLRDLNQNNNGDVWYPDMIEEDVHEICPCCNFYNGEHSNNCETIT